MGLLQFREFPLAVVEVSNQLSHLLPNPGLISRWQTQKPANRKDRNAFRYTRHEIEASLACERSHELLDSRMQRLALECFKILLAQEGHKQPSLALMLRTIHIE